MAKARPVQWTREHSLIALNLYRKLPFGKFDQHTALIIEVANAMGRSPSSLAMKLSNFASLDPVLRARGIKGLSGASAADRELWNRFHSELNQLAPESEQLLHDLFTRDQRQDVDFLHRDKVRLERRTEGTATVKTRRGQQFFRQTVLNAYDVRCCISGINVPELLVASHIRPWRAFPADRLNPRNGLCLSSLHDDAFDEGLVTLDEELRLVLSPRLKGYFPQLLLEQAFTPFEGRTIQVPDDSMKPDPQFVGYHRENVFER